MSRERNGFFTKFRFCADWTISRTLNGFFRFVFNFCTIVMVSVAFEIGDCKPDFCRKSPTSEIRQDFVFSFGGPNYDLKPNNMLLYLLQTSSDCPRGMLHPHPRCRSTSVCAAHRRGEIDQIQVDVVQAQIRQRAPFGFRLHRFVHSTPFLS